MEKSSLKTIITTGIVAVLVVGLPLFLWGRYQGYKANFKTWDLQTPEPAPTSISTSTSAVLQTYASPSGLFAFKYPQGYSVSESADPENTEHKIVFINKVDAVGAAVQGPPVMQITVLRKYAVAFSSWEGKDWSGFDDVVHSFVFKK